MTEKILQSLEGVSKTLLMTLYVRARESQRPDGMIRDDLAVAMVNNVAQMELNVCLVEDVDHNKCIITIWDLIP